MERNAQDTKEWLNEVLPSVDVHLQGLLLTDPRDYESLLSMTRTYTLDFLAPLPDDTEIIINASSGTSQMHAVWLLLASSNIYNAPRLFQVANPVTMTPGSQRVTEIRIPFMHEESLMASARHYIEQGAYVAAAGALDEVARTSAYAVRRFTSQVLGKAMRAYSAWQVLDYTEALKLLTSSANSCENCNDLLSVSALLSSQVATLRILEKHQNSADSYKETFHNLVDLYHNCIFHAAAGDTAGCLARFWRLREGLLHHHFRSIHRVEPLVSKSTPGPSAENEAKLDKYLALKGKKRGNTTLNMYQLRNVLTEVFGDPKFDRMDDMMVTVKRGCSMQEMQLGKALEDLRQRRNDSCAAHGMKPVSKDTAETCILIGKHMLASYFSGREDEIVGYTFSPDRISELSKVLV